MNTGEGSTARRIRNEYREGATDRSIEERLQRPEVVSAADNDEGKHVHLIPKRRNLPELLDLPPESYTLDELDGNLTDMTLVNPYLGNGRAVQKTYSREPLSRSGHRRG